MKKIVIACMALFFVSCSNYIINDIDLYFDNIDDIWMYTSSIEYRTDGNDHWQLPDETYRLNSGDCEDICTMFQYLAEKAGYKAYIIIEKTGTGYHAFIFSQERYIEPQVYGLEYDTALPVLTLKSYKETVSYSKIY